MRETADEQGTPAFAAGQVIAARWRVERFLARGGMGEVYEATDLELGGAVALKTLLATRADSERAVERFRREVRLARRVTHANVARVFDVARHEHGSSALTIYTMELLRGESLSERLRREGALVPREVAELARGAALGLSAAHQARVLHRDFKSSNVMLVAGTPPAPELQSGASDRFRGHPSPVRAVVTDFGLARAFDEDVLLDASLSHDAKLLGTPAYMAPEQVEGREIGVGTDVYAFGVVLFEMLTGALPFTGSSAFAIAAARLTSDPPPPSTRASWLDPAWDALVGRCLARRPEDRFASMHELALALETLALNDASAPPERGAVVNGHARTLTLGSHYGLPAAASSTRPDGVAIAEASSVLSATLARRRPGVRIAALLFAILLVGSGALYLFEQRKPPLLAPVGGRPSLVVMALSEPADADVRRRTAALSAMLADELSAGDGLSVESADTLIDAPRDVKRLGALLGVDYVLDVSAIKSDAHDVSLQVFDVAHGAVQRSFHAALDRGARVAAEQLAQDTRSAFGLGAPEAREQRAARAALPGDGEAIRLYLEGKDLLLHFDAARAAPLLARAVSLEPEFALAHAVHSRALADLGRTREAVAAADLALAAARRLPRELALAVEAQSYEARHAWDKAATVYRSLHGFYPENRQYTLDLARALVLASHPHEAWDALNDLLAKDPSAEQDPRVLLARAEAANSMGDHKTQLPLAERARDRAHEMGARALEARAILALANARVKLAPAVESLKDYERAEQLYDELHISGGAARAAVQAAWAYGLADRDDEALAAAERALAVARAGGDRRLEAIAVAQTGFALQKTDPALARKRYEQGLAMLREIGSTMNVIWALGNLASLDQSQGKLADARARQEERASLSRNAGNDEDAATALISLASIALKAGELDAATRAVDAALPIVVDRGFTARQASVLLTRADVHLERAELELASEVLDEAARRYRSVESASGERSVQARRAQVERALGHDAAAEPLLRADIEQSQKAGDPSGAAWSVIALAELQTTAGRAADTAALSAALELLRAQDVRDGVAWGESVLARGELIRGQRSAALELARRSLEHAAPLESRILRLRSIANAAPVLRSLGHADEARAALSPALAEATRLGLTLRVSELRRAASAP